MTIFRISSMLINDKVSHQVYYSPKFSCSMVEDCVGALSREHLSREHPVQGTPVSREFLLAEWELPCPEGYVPFHTQPVTGMEI